MKKRGFTIIEVTIAVSILAVIMGVTYSALSQIQQGKRALDDKRELGMFANAILNRLTKELQLAHAGIPLLPPPSNLGKKMKTNINLVGQPENNGKSDADTITFIAQGGGQYVPEGKTRSGFVQITYRLAEPPPDDVSAHPDTLYLVREEIPNIRPFDKAYEEIMVFPVATNVLSLSFDYYDLESDTWSKEWGDETHPKLPALIKFSVELKSPLGIKERYTTAVALKH